MTHVPDFVKKFYASWCKQTKRGGSVLVGSSIRELLTDAHAANSQELARIVDMGLEVIKKLDGVHQTMNTPIGISECTEAFRIELEKIKYPWKFKHNK